MGEMSAKESINMRGSKITTFILYNAVMKLKQMKEGEDQLINVKHGLSHIS